jgi:hypothetical protein
MKLKLSMDSDYLIVLILCLVGGAVVRWLFW